MHRWLTVAVASLGIALLGADSPQAPALETVGILNSIDANGGLSILEIAYVSAALAVQLQGRGIVATRVDKSVPSLEQSGAYLCEDANMSVLVEPTILSTQTGREEGTGQWNTVRIQLTRFDCSTHAIAKIVSGSNSGFDWTAATEKSIADVVKRYVLATAPAPAPEAK